MRIQHYTEALDINFPPIALRNLGHSPPWQEFITNMDLSMCEHNKPTTLPSTFRTLFLAIQEKYNNYDEYYTDGSVTANHSGFTVVTNTNTVNSSRMHNMCSIWMCEVTAIIYALKSIIKKHEKSNNYIITRLRIGHTNLTHVHLITKSEPEVCPKCQETVTIKHLLNECNNLRLERSEVSLSNNIKILLNDQE
ncbi:Protein of unknown function, partial [Cotesia congregata]